MPRPFRCRRVGWAPQVTEYGPRGAGSSSQQPDDVVLGLDELEAIRLADLEGLYQQQVAEEMNVSRQTLGRILESAHRKVARFLVEGTVLRIGGGDVNMTSVRSFTCSTCNHTWEVPFGTGRPAECPACQSTNFHRSDSPCGRGQGRGPCRRRGGRGPQGQ